MSGPAKQEFVYMPIGMLVLAPNVREKPGNLDQLADSIGQHGVLEPIICCPHSTEVERFEVLMGQRRFLAAKKAGARVIPALVRPKPTEHERVLLQVAENFERDDMSPIDEALAFRQLLNGGMTNQALQKTVHRSYAFIKERLDCLALPSVVQGALHVGMVSPKCALAIPKVLLNRVADDKKLERQFRSALTGGDQEVRDWVSMVLHTNHGPGSKPKMMQQFNCQMNQEVLRRIKRAAAKEGRVLGEWCEEALDAAATAILDGAAA